MPAAAPRRPWIPKWVTISSAIAPRIAAASRVMGISRGWTTMRRKTANPITSSTSRLHTSIAAYSPSPMPSPSSATSENRGQHPLDHGLAGPDGDDDEAPEDDEVVLAAQGAHEPRPAPRGQGGLLDDLLLAEEVGHHRLHAIADPIVAPLRPPREHQTAETPHCPGKHRQSRQQHRGKDDLFHGQAFGIVTQRAARRESASGEVQLGWTEPIAGGSEPVRGFRG